MVSAALRRTRARRRSASGRPRWAAPTASSSAPRTSPSRSRKRSSRTMGQKVHPIGFRLGYNKTWRSRWYAEKEYANLLHEDLALKKDLKKRFAHAGVSRGRDRARRQQAQDHHPHLAARHHHRPQGAGGRQAEAGGPEADGQGGLHQHPGDPEARARRAAGLRVGGAAAREAHRLPPRDAQGGRRGAALRRARDQDPRLGPPERRRDRALRVVPARPAAAAHAARRHRLRLPRGAHHASARSASRPGSTGARATPLRPARALA